MEKYFIPAVVTFWLAMVITPIIKIFAMKLNIVDNPNARKVHREPIPLLGGLAIFISFILGLLVFYKSATSLNLRGVVFGGGLMVLLGFIDDKYGMKWRTKLIGQIIAAMLVYLIFGVSTTIFNWTWVNLIITVFWIVGITNALNLLDNMDGLAAGISAIAAFFFFILAHQAQQWDLAMFSLILASASAGFLKYNFSPAAIFMGDMGSLFLGFTLASIGILLQVTSLNSWAIIGQFQILGDYQVITALVPVLVLGLPIFDTTLVSVMRTLNGLAISTPGKDHSSHRLTKFKGKLQRILNKFVLVYIRATGRRNVSQHSSLAALGHTRAVLVLYASAICFGLAALMITHLELLEAVLLLVMVIGLAIFAARKLGSVQVYKK